MEIIKLFVGIILPYAAIAIFIAGMIWRIQTWRKLASPAITLFPTPPNEQANTLNTIKEALFFKSLFQGDRALWFFAWVFHAALALIFIGHFRVFFNADVILKAMGMSDQAIDAMSMNAGGAAGVVILAAALVLLVRRLVSPRVNEITGFGDYFALFLIGAILVTGNLMRFGSEHINLAETRKYFAGLAVFGAGTDETILRNSSFLVHISLAWLLMMTIPFSKILHLGGIFFTHQLIRKS
ncbi:MAG: respiratory nitrate reductase subunit gamma [Elusimicrobia bacterium]|nr:respiratory nitrate reductase subunit gamma [Elusimicrobiota bacterium]